MKFILNREQLLAPLQQIVSVIEKRQTLPILSNILIVVDAGTLILTGTDLEIQIVAKLAVEKFNAGKITIPARKFLDICRLLPNEASITVETKGDKVKVTSAKSRFSLSCLNAEDYPEFSEANLEHHIVLNAKQLKHALDKTIFCMANQDVRYYLNGLMLNISNSKLKLVASDGHRLAIYEDEMPIATGFEARIILPRKAVIELNRLLTNPETEINLHFSSNNIKIEINNLIFSAKLVDAKYPDFSKVFQQKFLEPIHVQKQLLKNALTRVSVLANEKFKGVSFDISPNSLKISTHNPEHDEAEEEISIGYAGKAIVIAFNSQYLLDAITNIDADEAQLIIAENMSSCFIEAPNTPKSKFIVMPMRL